MCVIHSFIIRSLKDAETLGRLFGTLSFEGEVVRSVLLKTFSARTQYDDKDCALCDVALDADGNIVVVDRDNRKVLNSTCYISATYWLLY